MESSSMTTRFPFTAVTQRVQLDPHAVAPFLLGGLNKGPANIVILYNALFIGNPGLLTE